MKTSKLKCRFCGKIENPNNKKSNWQIQKADVYNDISWGTCPECQKTYAKYPLLIGADSFD